MGQIHLTVQGKGDIVLSEEQDFLGKGGEGIVYEKNGIVFKVFHNLSQMTPPQKIRELQVLDHPSIVRPLDILLDSKHREVGFTMNFVEGEVLCKLFNTTYLTTHSISYQNLLDLIEHIQTTTGFIHSKQCLIVDGNEMNYLVSSSDYTFPFFIDVGCYETPNFPPVAISPLYKDPHNNVYSELTDWYSFAILVCKILVGVHPYKGRHPSYMRKELFRRMEDNVSIFDSDVSIPSSSRSISLIPKMYRSWLEGVLQDGDRSIPPSLSNVVGPSASYVSGKLYTPHVSPFHGNVVLSEKTLEPIFCWMDDVSTSLAIRKLFVEYNGMDNRSGKSMSDVANAIKLARRCEYLESIIVLLIGVNADDCKQWLDEFYKECGFDKYENIENLNVQSAAHFAGWVSSMTTSQSQALGTGGPSQVLQF